MGSCCSIFSFLCSVCKPLFVLFSFFYSFSPGPPDFSTNKTDRHDITKTLLKVALNTITLTLSFHFLSNIMKKVFKQWLSTIPLHYLSIFNWRLLMIIVMSSSFFLQLHPAKIYYNISYQRSNIVLIYYTISKECQN
jgi:hypothetical protein